MFIYIIIWHFDSTYVWDIAEIVRLLNYLNTKKQINKNQYLLNTPFNNNNETIFL